jgi:hypothetical protein
VAFSRCDGCLLGRPAHWGEQGLKSDARPVVAPSVTQVFFRGMASGGERFGSLTRPPTVPPGNGGPADRHCRTMRESDSQRSTSWTTNPGLSGITPAATDQAAALPPNHAASAVRKVRTLADTT